MPDPGNERPCRAAAIVIACFLLACCLSCTPSPASEPQRYSVTYLDLFDTVTQITGYAPDEAAFRETAEGIHDLLLRYHRLFDIYHEYDGMTNLCTLNRLAPDGPVEVDPDILRLLSFGKDMHAATSGRVNIAMGSVLRIWHEAREEGLADPANAALPDPQTLSEASGHTSIDALIVDEASGTVRFADPLLRIDVGAIAKGWAAQRAAEQAPANMLLNLGGNVVCTGPKKDGSAWIIGVADPDGSSGSYSHKLHLTEGATVTSGDYQRYYTVGVTRYHHLIDPDTNMPGTYWRAVTVLLNDSGKADALSTALFLLPEEEARKLCFSFGAEAMWTRPDGTEICTDGFGASLAD